ncbi:hypothetical protein E4P43_10175 [Blastococcus sp. TF02A-35]|nr:hypothetical protein E4P43_10175 [Blastococcus sp. TF02A_35]
MPETTDPEERRRRRALLRAHHPDLGGDPSEFLRVMAELEGRARRAGPRPADDIRFVRRPRGLARIAAWFHRRRRPRRVV